jgi:pimeloyl-ACP methyl ester carboxylesterase
VRIINTSDGIRIHYVSSGETNGHLPVIFIPGWSFTSQIWQTQVGYFAKNRRVIAIHPRSQAYGINERRQLVGVSCDADGVDCRALFGITVSFPQTSTISKAAFPPASKPPKT